MEGISIVINFACLQTENYCGMGARYVNTLASMIGRNLRQDFKLHCLTDEPEGLDPRIDVIPLPAGLEKWWGKLYLFKRGIFKDGEQVFFFDLDTVIINSLDEIVKYRGQFAVLQDFYWPHLIGPGVMAWTANAYTESVWEEWDACGRTRHPQGDLWWLNTLDQGRFAKHADRLQMVLPGAFVSYKVHCRDAPPAADGPSVVAFHGFPRPHEVEDQWVKEAWQ